MTFLVRAEDEALQLWVFVMFMVYLKIGNNCGQRTEQRIGMFGYLASTND